jgi:hypothetical protein
MFQNPACSVLDRARSATATKQARVNAGGKVGTRVHLIRPQRKAAVHEIHLALILTENSS